MSTPTKKDLLGTIAALEQERETLQAAAEDEAQARRRAEAQRDRFFTLSLDMLLVADMKGRLQEVSPSLERTLGYAPRHLLTRPFLDFIHPEDKAAARREMEKLAAGLPAVSQDLRWRCEDGAYKWLAWTAVPAPEEGVVYAIARDASERRRMEEVLAEERHLLTALIDSLPERIYVKDAQGRYLLSNLAHRRFLNLQSPDEVRGKTVFDFFPKTLAAKYYVDDQLVILERRALFSREEPITGADGVLRWASTAKALLHDRRGRVTGLICWSREITDRERRQALERENAEVMAEVRELAALAPASEALPEPRQDPETGLPPDFVPDAAPELNPAVGHDAAPTD